MENPNHLNEPNKAILEVNPVVPEPNQVVDIHDPNEMVDVPDDIDLVDYDEEDPEEDPEEEPEEDVDIELEDDVELIFPYEVEGDKTLPPGDVSSDSVSSDSMLYNIRWIMPPKPMSEARMREIIRDQVTTSMNEFMANMNRGAGGAGAGGAGADGAEPVEAEVTGCTYMTFMKCNPHTFKGTEGAVGLCQWFEKL
ncbi:hypothetical protein Tco_0836402, partial [Tanacetum coccineum]